MRGRVALHPGVLRPGFTIESYAGPTVFSSEYNISTRRFGTDGFDAEYLRLDGEQLRQRADGRQSDHDRRHAAEGVERGRRSKAKEFQPAANFFLGKRAG